MDKILNILWGAAVLFVAFGIPFLILWIACSNYPEYRF